MKVKTQTRSAKTARQMVAELLLTGQPAIEVAHDPDPSCGRSSSARSMAWPLPQAQRRDGAGYDNRSHVAMAVNLDRLHPVAISTSAAYPRV